MDFLALGLIKYKGTDEMNTEIKVILPFEKKGEFFVEQLGEIERKPVYDFVKRVFDVVVYPFASLLFFIFKSF